MEDRVFYAVHSDYDENNVYQEFEGDDNQTKTDAIDYAIEHIEDRTWVDYVVVANGEETTVEVWNYQDLVDDLPTEYVLEKDFLDEDNFDDEDALVEMLGNEISNRTGWCVEGFNYEDCGDYYSITNIIYDVL